jgi:flagellar biosynthetic protein FliQ
LQQALQSDGRRRALDWKKRPIVTPQEVVSLAQEAVSVTILLSAPLLLTALAVGLAISILQAATQVNEMTLSFIPKLLALFAALVLAGPWMLGLMGDYMTRIFSNIALVTG